MEVCGNIMVNNQYTEFRLKCLYCSIESQLQDWELFIHHVHTSHYTEEVDEGVEGVVWRAGDDAVVDTDIQEKYELPMDIIEEDEFWQHDEAERETFVMEEADLDTSENTEQKTIIEIRGEPSIGEMLGFSDEEVVHTAESANDAVEDNAFFDDVAEKTDTYPTKLKAGRPRKRFKIGQVFKLKINFIRRNPRVLHLIEAYREHPCLYNPSDDNYKNPEARSQAYEVMIKRMDDKANVLFTESELKRCLNQLHSQYILAGESAAKGKLVGLAARHYKRCEFLKSLPYTAVSDLEDEEDGNGDGAENSSLLVIKLNFREPNVLTTKFIHSYSNHPELYDPSITEFGSVEARSQAYIKMAEDMAPLVKANETDVYLAVNKLRKWAYEGLRRLKSKELFKAWSKQELNHLKMCNFLPPKAEGQVLYCDYCCKRFYGDYMLRVHIYKQHHIGDLPFICSYCPRRFDRHNDMDRHILRAHCENALKCEYCDKTFAINNDLMAHRACHTGHKPYVCEMCGKRFRLKLLLDHHINGFHLNLRPFVCDLCCKSFRKKFELTNHIKAHLDIRDKVCDQCSATFTCHSALSRHRRIVHKAAPALKYVLEEND
ncbi:uncharacterized protein Dwil_GK10700 [Drosophila willistoni]|uniref:C2H2-type domain-containing protein n=1 Tax=Drosophila willistoni TaxID=7260 RepID=B4MIN4_DROWI|nr:zinc finger and BTB domain-containing protein 24 [Drosophila willistoni]EDW71973.1 uncharacterized protein Dwil_GK10700 [Drosophila willistoni]